MAVSFTHFLRLMAHELIDLVLVNAVSSQVAGKRMAKNVVAAEHLPSTTVGHIPESVPGCPVFEWITVILAEQVLASRMSVEPTVDRQLQLTMQWDFTKGNPAITAAFLFADQNLVRDIIDLAAKHL